MLVSLAPAVAVAQAEPSGVYLTAYGQFTRIGASSLSESGAQGAGSGLRASFGRGLGGGGDLGYRFGNGWAAEVEWNYRTHALSSLRQSSTTLATSGDFASNTILVNGLRRFTSTAPLTPYLGAGLGWILEIDLDIKPGSGGPSRAYSRSGKVAPQLIAGVEYALSPKLRLVSDARWLRAGPIRSDNATGNSGGSIASPNYNPLSLQVGLRVGF
ncbi:outer membrane beta-barrel protein [Gemmatimonas sp.]|uniref:outer membrane protein n=1 Tax=Gemmatimonas sp. TaxID=1962908 RepID=UPI003341E3E8